MSRANAYGRRAKPDMNQMDLMIDRIIEKHNPTVAGLDTRVEYLPEEFIAELGIGAIDTMEKAAQAILAYNKRLIKALSSLCAFPSSTPCPTNTSGRSALFISSAASFTESSSVSGTGT